MMRISIAPEASYYITRHAAFDLRSFNERIADYIFRSAGRKPGERCNQVGEIAVLAICEYYANKGPPRMFANERIRRSLSNRRRRCLLGAKLRYQRI